MKTPTPEEAIQRTTQSVAPNYGPPGRQAHSQIVVAFEGQVLERGLQSGQRSSIQIDQRLKRSKRVAS